MLENNSRCCRFVATARSRISRNSHIYEVRPRKARGRFINRRCGFEPRRLRSRKREQRRDFATISQQISPSTDGRALKFLLAATAGQPLKEIDICRDDRKQYRELAFPLLKSPTITVANEEEDFEIFSRAYGQDKNVCCEPSTEEIEKAVREKDLEKRQFQKDLSELIPEWEPMGTERYNLIRKYHALRIAFFVVNRWDNYPIVLKQDGREVDEGSHRLRAALHLGMDTVEVLEMPRRDDLPTGIAA